MTVMFRKEHVLLAGNYMEFYHNEDYYLWVRMHLRGYQFYNLPLTLVKARIDDSFYNRRGGWRYFNSEYRIQKFMLENKVIGYS